MHIPGSAHTQFNAGTCVISADDIVFSQPLNDIAGAMYLQDSKSVQMATVTTNLSTHLEETYELDVSEMFPCFNVMVEEQMNQADACITKEECEQLKAIFYENWDFFAHDSYDFGETDLHIAQIPTDPDMKPVYVRQYWLPMRQLLKSYGTSNSEE